MNRSLLFLSIIFTFFLISCKHSYRISVKEPAVIRLPDETNVIGIINNVTKENSPEKVISSMLGTEQLNGNVVAAERATDGVLRSLGNTQTMRGEIIQMDSSYLTNGVLDWSILDSVGKARGIDGFIEMCELRTVSPVGGAVLANVTGQTNNQLSGTMIINVHVVSTGVNYERYSVNKTYNIPISGSTSIVDILNDVQRKREYYRALGFELGYRVGELIYPNWVWVGRTYYTRGTTSIKRAKNMLRQGNWDIAERQLLMDVDYPKEGKRGRVLFNLALAKEAQGEIDLAIEYAERSALECGNKEANEYLVKLKNRKRQIEQL